MQSMENCSIDDNYLMSGCNWWSFAHYVPVYGYHRHKERHLYNYNLPDIFMVSGA